MRRLVLLVLALFPIAIGAQAPLRYRIEAKLSSAMDMSALFAGMPPEEADQAAAMAGAMVPAPTTTLALVSVATRDSAGGMLVHLVIDSIVSDQFAMLRDLKTGFPPAMHEMITSGKGGTIDFFMLNGVQTNVRSMPQMNLEVYQVAAFLPVLFPMVPDSVKHGAAWADTAKQAAAPVMPPGMEGLSSVQKGRPLTTTWRWIAPDILESTTDGEIILQMGTTLGGKTVTAGKRHFVLDTRRMVRDATEEQSTTIAASMGNSGLPSSSTKILQSVTLSRLPERP